MKDLFAVNPVWKNGPRICKATWLPAFETMKELNAFSASNGTGTATLNVFECKACNCFHAQTMSKGPGANSASGIDRISKLSKEEIASLAKKYRKFTKPKSE